MKKLTAILLILALIAGLSGAMGEEAVVDKYEHLRVGTTTEFNGNFFADTLG